MVMVAENVPDGVVVMLAGEVVSVIVANFMVTALLAENPVPLIVTVVPSTPLSGDKVSWGKVTMNVASVELKPSLAVMT
jgi:hypothetical protein